MAFHSGDRETPFTTAAATAAGPARPLHAAHSHSEKGKKMFFTPCNNRPEMQMSVIGSYQLRIKIKIRS